MGTKKSEKKHWNTPKVMSLSIKKETAGGKGAGLETTAQPKKTPKTAS